MPLPLWLPSSRPPAAAAPQRQQQLKQQQGCSGSVGRSHSCSYSHNSTPSSSSGGSSSSSASSCGGIIRPNPLHVQAAAASAAATFPLPDQHSGVSHFSHSVFETRHDSLNTASSQCSSSNGGGSGHFAAAANAHIPTAASAAAELSNRPAAAADAAAAAAVDAFVLLAASKQGAYVPGWQLSSRIRQSVEEALRGGNGGMQQSSLQWPQQQQQQEHEQQEEQQLHHATWQQLIQVTEGVGVSPRQVQAAAAAAAVAATAAADVASTTSTTTSSTSSTSTSSSSSSTPPHVLTKRIQSCKTAADLAELLHQHQQLQLDHVHTAAAYVQLARLHRKHQQQQQQQGSEQQGQEQLGTCATGSAAAHVQDHHHQQQQQQQRQHYEEGVVELLQLLEPLALRRLHQMHSRHTSNILWACASLQHTPCQPLLQGLLTRAQTLLVQGTTPQGFANTIWAAATLRVCPSDEWLSLFFVSSQHHLCNFQPQELSSSIWALAQLGVRLPPGWRHAYMTAAAAKLGSTGSQALSNMLWGFAKLGLAVPADIWAAMTYTCSLRSTEFSAKGLVQLLWAAGMLAGKQQKQQQQQQHVAEQRQRQQDDDGLRLRSVQQAHAGGLSGSSGNSSNGASGGVAGSSDLCSQTAWLQPLLCSAEQQLPQFSANSLANILWSVAVLHHQPDQQFVVSCMERLVQHTEQLSPAGAASAVWAISKLAPPVGATMQQLVPVLVHLQQQLPQCNPQQCLYVAAALANFKQQQRHGTDAAAVPAAGAAGDAVASEPSGSSAVKSLEQELLCACSQQLPSFRSAQLAQLAKWLLAAGTTPDAAWVHIFFAAAARQLATMQPQQQLPLLHAVAQWKVQPQLGWSALFLAAVTAQNMVQQYSAAHVGALLQAMAGAGMQPGQQQLQVLLEQVLAAQVGHHTMQDAATADGTSADASCWCPAAAAAAVLSGLCSVGYKPAPGWAHRFWQANAATLPRAEPAGLAAIASILQHPDIKALGLKPNKPFIAAYHAALVAVLPQLQPQQAASVLAGMAALHLEPKQQQHEQLLPCLMAAAAKGLYTMSVKQVVAAWWGLVELGVLDQAVSLQDALLPAGQRQQQQQQQDQPWQQQWQALWLRRLFSSSLAGQQQQQAQAHSLSSIGLAPLMQLADALSRLQQPVPAAWAQSYVAAVSAHLPVMAPHQMQQLLCVLPMLGGAAAFPQLCWLVLVQLQPALDRLSPRQLSQALCMAHQAGCKPSELWLHDYVRAVSQQLPSFTSHQLIRVFVAMARLRYAPEPVFLAAATDAAVDSLQRYRVLPTHMVDLLWSLTALRVRPNAAWMARFEARLLERGPERLDGQELSRLGWCLGALQRKPGRVLWSKWLAATAAAMGSMDGSSLADILWSCAMMDEQPSGAWLDTFVSASKQHISSMSSSSLATIVWALAMLQHRPPSEWMQPCLASLARSLAATAAAATATTDASGSHSSTDTQALQQQVEALSPQQLTRVIWALAALDCQLPGQITQQLLQLSVTVVVGVVDADSLAQLVWAWDRLDDTPSKQLVQTVAAAARTHMVLPELQDGPAGTHTAATGPLQGYSARQPGMHQPGSFDGSSGRVRPLLNHARRPGAVRVGSSSRVVIRPQFLSPTTRGGSSSGNTAVAASQQHQPQQVVANRVAELAAMAAAHGVVPNREVVAVLRQAKVAGGRQQLLLRLRQIQAQGQGASDANSTTHGGSSSRCDGSGVVSYASI